MQHVNDELLIMVAIETLEGASNVEELCEVEGVDGIFIGPMDLSTNMGYFANPKAEAVQDKIREIEQIVLAKKKLLGTVAGNMEQAKALYDRGYSYVIFSSDSGNLAASMNREMKEFHAYKELKK